MKKIFQFTLLCALTVTLAGCGENKPSTEAYVESYQEACASLDFEKAHNILSSLHAEHLKSMSQTYTVSFGPDNDETYAWTQCSEGRANVEATAVAYLSAVQFVFTSEARTIFAEFDNPEDKITYLYTEIRQIGTKHNSTTCSLGVEFHDPNDWCLQKIYNKYVECVNSFSNSVLDLAINAGNKRLAAIAVAHILDVYEGLEKGGYLDQVSVLYSDKEKVAAQEKFDQAVKNGLFD